jgi:selenocysteine-specific elongation factor
LHVLATAGHVDHGKSTLVHALTGIDPDRWAEEKQRGLTIDLGFAWTVLPSGAEVAFVDVPGHVRFIKNMLAGVGAVDGCVFVVSAAEGWKPQSEEHLRILGLLGIGHGIVALTNAARVDDDWRELALLDVVEHVQGTFLESAEIIAVDAPAGIGVDALRAALDRLLDATPTAADGGRPRLWIDRAFAAKGSGTVVTGTLTGGALHVEDDVVIEPGGRRGRVRALQSHNQPLTTATPGRRLAVNVAGVAHDSVRRGQALVRPGQWHLSRVVDASLTVLDATQHEVGRKGAYVTYIGSGEHPTTLRLLRRASAVAPGRTAAARLFLAADLPLLPGDRYVLRESGRGQTIGGGAILDVQPVLPAAKAQPDRSVTRVVNERGWVLADELERLTGERVAPTLGGWVVSDDALAAERAHIAAAVNEAGAAGIDIAGLDERGRLVLATVEGITVRMGRAAAATRAASHPFLAALEAARFDPPPPTGVNRLDLRELAQQGQIVDCGGTWFAASAVDEAARTVARLLAEAPDGITVAAFRDALGTSRKHAVPLLTHLDASGITRRRGDLRIAGPRLPPA